MLSPSLGLKFMKGYGLMKQNKLPSFINRYPFEGRKTRVTTLCRCKIHPTLKVMNHHPPPPLELCLKLYLRESQEVWWGGHSQKDGLKTI